jgi:hypothetical protein
MSDFTVTSRKGEWKDAIDKYTRHPPLFDPPTTTTQSVGFFVREMIISSIGVLVYCMFPSIICGSQDAACRFVRRHDLWGLRGLDIDAFINAWVRPRSSSTVCKWRLERSAVHRFTRAGSLCLAWIPGLEKVTEIQRSVARPSFPSEMRLHGALAAKSLSKSR